MKKLIILLVALAAMNGSLAQWVQLTSGTTNALNSVFFIDVDTGYAVGWDGTILKTTDGGNNWENQVSGTVNSLASVFFTNADTGYVVGDSGTILKTTNGGIVWEALESGTYEPLMSVHFPHTETGYVVGNGAIILKTTDGGQNWISQYWGTQTLTWLNTVQFTDLNNGYACGGQLGGCLQQDGILLKTTNGGVEWTLSLLFGIEYGILYSLSAVDSNTVFAIGSREEGPAHTDLVTTINGGTNWSAGYISGSQTRSVFFIDSQTGFIVGRESENGEGTVLKTTDGGLTWMEQSVGISVWLNSVYFPTANTGYIVGDNGVILKTLNGGYFSGCLSEGITFTNQEQIDNFQINYPGCTTIEGNVTISDGFTGNITNLQGLDALTTIGGNLSLMANNALTGLTGLNNVTTIGGNFFLGALGGGNNALTSLTGMESLTFIGGNVFIGGNNSLSSLTGLNNLAHIGLELFIAQNEVLSNLTALENLVSIGGGLVISENNALTSLSGLDNIEAGSVASLSINGNQSLSTCQIESVCIYLAAPNGSTEIHDNAPGCNNPEEVEAACDQVSIESIGFDDDYLLFPNPAGKTVTISGNNATAIREIFIYNQTGQKVLQGNPVNNTLDISKLRPGMYIIELITKQGKVRKKLMVE